MQKVLDHYKKADQIIYPYIQKYIGKITLKKHAPKIYFERLCESIIYQQLSGKAALTIFNRFLDLFPDKTFTPEQVIRMGHEKMRGAGLSNAKANYVKNIAQAQIEGLVDFNSLDKLSNEEIIERLVKIKGVGLWTAEMFLIFTMGKENVFSTGDLGLKKGLMKIYNLKKAPTKEWMLKKTKKWSPYKSYGSITLWRSLDDKEEDRH